MVGWGMPEPSCGGMKRRGLTRIPLYTVGRAPSIGNVQEAFRSLEALSFEHVSLQPEMTSSSKGHPIFPGLTEIRALAAAGVCVSNRTCGTIAQVGSAEVVATFRERVEAIARQLAGAFAFLTIR